MGQLFVLYQNASSPSIRTQDTENILTLVLLNNDVVGFSITTGSTIFFALRTTFTLFKVFTLLTFDTFFVLVAMDVSLTQ